MIITHAPGGVWPEDTTEEGKIQPSHIAGMPHLFVFEESDLAVFRGAQGAQGEPGEPGAQGAQGVQGEQGAQGVAPAGAVVHFAMVSAPVGWLVCNGAAVSRATYALLFGAIGTIYGDGDGAATFNLPDLRGEFIRGLDAGRGVDAGRVIGSAQGDLIKDHKHVLDVATASGSAGTYNNRIAGAQDGSGSFTSGYVGQSQASGGAETRPRNIAMLACISTGGV